MSRRVFIALGLLLILGLGAPGWAAQKPAERDPSLESVTPAQKAQLTKAMALVEKAIENSNKGLFWESLMAFDEAQDVVVKAFGPEHPQTAASFQKMGRTYEEDYNWNMAIPLYKRTLKIREKVLGPEHLDTVATMSRLARVYVMRGYFQQGLPLAQRSLQIREKVLGPVSPDTAETLAILGFAYSQMGAHAQAKSLTERALNIRERVLGPEHPETAESLDGLAVLYAQL